LKLKNVELHNFRVFKDHDNIFDFDSEIHKNVILVNGSNGAGKTSLLMGLKWGFYGTSGIASWRTSIGQMVNRVARTEDDGVMYVKIFFEHDGHDYTLKRSVQFNKVPIWDKTPTTFSDAFSVEEGGSIVVDSRQKDWDQKAQTTWVDGILPEEASQFFFFDGEKIRGYTEDPQVPRVVNAIEMVLGIKELLNARDDFKGNIITDFRSELNSEARKDQGTRELGQSATKLEDEIKDINKKISSYKEKLEQVDMTIKNINEDWSKNKENSAKFTRRNEADEKVKKLQDYKETLHNERVSFNADLAALFIIPFIKILNQGKSTNVVRTWERDAATRLLQDGKDCICGRPLNAEAKERIENLIKTGKHHGIGSLLDASDIIVNKFGTERLSIDFEEIRTKRVANENEIKTAKEAFEKIKKEIGSTIDSGFDAAKAEEDLEKAESQRDTWKEEKAKLEGQLVAKERDEKILQDKIDKLTAGTKLAEATAKHKMSKRVLEAINKAIERLVSSRRKKVEELTSEIFLKIISTPDQFKGIKIDEEYTFSLVHSDGVSIPTSQAGVNAGHAQMIATAFIAALNKMSERKASVIIDTPLGRLDNVNSSNMIRYYPEFQPQVIILYQTEEIASPDTQDAIQSIESNIHSEYEIIQDPLINHLAMIKRKK